MGVLEVCKNPEQIFSLAALFAARSKTRVGETALKGEKPHQGVASKKSALFLGQQLWKSRTALGLREWRGKTALGTAVGANSGGCDPTVDANCGSDNPNDPTDPDLPPAFVHVRIRQL